MVKGILFIAIIFSGADPGVGAREPDPPPRF